MKVLFILHLPPPVHGAAMVGQYIKDSVAVNRAFDCHFVNMTTATSLEDVGRGGLRKLWRFVSVLRKVMNMVRNVKPDVVYVTPNTSGGKFYKDFIVVQTLKMMGTRVVVHLHNTGVAAMQDHWLDDKLYRLFFRGLKVILLGEVLYRDVEKYVAREDVYVCPNGIPGSSLSRNDVDVSDKAVPRVLFLSNMLMDKGVFVLLDALKALREQGVAFICDMVGGETRDIGAARLIKELTARGLQDIVSYHGERFGDDKLAFFAKSDIYVLPSFAEACPLTILEAMEQGLPVVATTVGGIVEQVEDGVTGLLCPSKDSASLATALATLIKDVSMRRRMGVASRARFLRYFTLSSFEERFIAALNHFMQ